MGETIGTPSKKGMKDAAINFGVGVGGGLIYKIVTGITGSGLLGGLAGAIVAGSVIKGDRGEMISTVLGFNAINSAAPAASATSASPDADIM